MLTVKETQHLPLARKTHRLPRLFVHQHATASHIWDCDGRKEGAAWHPGLTSQAWVSHSAAKTLPGLNTFADQLNYLWRSVERKSSAKLRLMTLCWILWNSYFADETKSLNVTDLILQSVIVSFNVIFKWTLKAKNFNLSDSLSSAVLYQPNPSQLQLLERLSPLQRPQCSHIHIIIMIIHQDFRCEWLFPIFAAIKPWGSSIHFKKHCDPCKTVESLQWLAEIKLHPLSGLYIFFCICLSY